MLLRSVAIARILGATVCIVGIQASYAQKLSGTDEDFLKNAAQSRCTSSRFCSDDD